MTTCVLVLGALVGCTGPVAPGLGAPPPVPAERWVAEDKIRHFGASFAATGMTYGTARLALDAGEARVAAVVVATALGLSKELVDARGGGWFSMKDLAWDAAGVALGYVFVQQIQ